MKYTKRIAALILTVALAFTTALPFFASTPATPAHEGAQSAAKWLKWRNLSPKADEALIILAMARSGYVDIFSIGLTSYQSAVENYLRNSDYFKDKEGNIRYELYPASILSMTSVGKVANLLGSADLVMGISLQSNLDAIGPSGWAYALIAADCGNYEFTAGGDVSREIIVEKLLSHQQADGGFAPAGTASNTYFTALCLQALSNYTAGAPVAEATENALAYLLQQQQPGGEFTGTDGTETLTASAAVAAALGELGIDATEFGNGLLIDAILSYQNSNGSFSYTIGGAGNEEATAIGLLGLSSYIRFAGGSTPLFDMSDVYGASHNKLSPGMTTGVILSFITLFFITSSLIAFAVRSRLRLRKWAKLGLLDENGNRLSDDEIAARDGDIEARRRLEEAKARLEKQKALAASYNLPDMAENPEVLSARNEIDTAKERLQALYGTAKPAAQEPNESGETDLP